jgi:hypothetical protein
MFAVDIYSPVCLLHLTIQLKSKEELETKLFGTISLIDTVIAAGYGNFPIEVTSLSKNARFVWIPEMRKTLVQ